jgi:hypothetical protein
MRLPLVIGAVASLWSATPAVCAPAVAHILVEQHPDQRGDPARYVVRAQRCKDEVFRELRLADGRAPLPVWMRERPQGLAPNPMIGRVLDEGGLSAAQVLVAAVNACLSAQGLAGVRTVVSAEPSPDAPLE